MEAQGFLLNKLDWQDKVNSLLKFAIERCSLGDHLDLMVDWKVPLAKKELTILWKLKKEPYSTTDPLVRLEERYRSLERYFQTKYRLIRLGNSRYDVEWVIA